MEVLNDVYEPICNQCKYIQDYLKTNRYVS